MCKFGQSTWCMGCGWIGVWGGWVGGCVSMSIARRKFLMFSCEGPPWLRVQVLGVGPGYMDERIRPYNRHVTQHRQVEETKPEGSGRSTGVTPFTLARLHVPCPLLVQFVWVIIIFLFVSSCSSCFSCLIHILLSLSLCLFSAGGSLLLFHVARRDRSPTRRHHHQLIQRLGARCENMHSSCLSSVCTKGGGSPRLKVHLFV